MDLINERQHQLQLEAEENYKQVIQHLIEENSQLRKDVEARTKRCVPKDKNEDYYFMIHIDETYDDEDNVKIKFVRRSKSNWTKEFRCIAKSDGCLVYEDKMPISMSVCGKIKEAIKEQFDEDDYVFLPGSGDMIVVPGLETEVAKIARNVLDSFRE